MDRDDRPQAARRVAEVDDLLVPAEQVEERCGPGRLSVGRIQLGRVVQRRRRRRAFMAIPSGAEQNTQLCGRRRGTTVPGARSSGCRTALAAPRWPGHGGRCGPITVVAGAIGGADARHRRLADAGRACVRRRAALHQAPQRVPDCPVHRQVGDRAGTRPAAGSRRAGHDRDPARTVRSAVRVRRRPVGRLAGVPDRPRRLGGVPVGRRLVPDRL